MPNGETDDAHMQRITDNPPMEPQIRYCTTKDGVSIAYFTLGEGEPLVLMDVVYSHLQAEWDEPGQRQFYEAIARIATLVRYDHRGFGLSDRDVDDLSLDGLVLDLEAVVERTLPDGPFALVAQRGVTTPIAVTYAVRHPERLSHLVLTTPVARLPRDFAERMDSLLEAPGIDERSFSESVARVVQGWDDHDASRVLAARMRESVSMEGFRAFLAEMKRWDVRDILPAIRTPTLLTLYKGHPLFGEEYAREIAAVLPGARVAIIDGATSAERGARQNAAIAEFLTDGRISAPVLAPPAEKTNGVRTVLFTDMVGHTEMMQRLGDAKGREVLREHERITRETLRTHGGTEIKTDGDSFMVSFRSVTSAVDCAIALQRAFALHTESMPEPLQVRMGLNAGEPIEEDGDLFGATVILASRIAAKADAGEILVPDTVRGLLSGKNFLFSERGEFVPKGFDDAVRLYEVRWRD